MKTDAQRVASHHVDQFGPVCIERLCTKLSEEVGELCGAVIRDTEFRDSRHWYLEVGMELQDVLTVLMVIADRYGIDFETASRDAAEKFLDREFLDIIKIDQECPLRPIIDPKP